MQFKNYIRKPFTVEAVEITEENMSDVAELIGEVREKDGVTFIAINRRLVPNIHRAYVGWFVTKLGDNFRCYSSKVFNAEFVEHDPGSGYFFEEGPDTDEYTSVPIDDEGSVTVAHNVFDEASGNFKLVITPPISGS
jgi:hypothetical protein